MHTGRRCAAAPGVRWKGPRRPSRLWTLALVALAWCAWPAQAWAAVPLYGLFETSVTNGATYDNPFDYTDIELQATFTSPTGRSINGFGFYDGDGAGGQAGDVWKLRFMPDEVGTWAYTYTWTDLTPGGSGAFDVTDTGLPGPLRIAGDNPWYFDTARGDHFDARLYDMHHVGPEIQGSDWNASAALYTGIMASADFTNAGYNMVMVDSPTGSTTPNWWEGNITDTFDLSVWHDYENILTYALAHNIYLFPFDGIVTQGTESKMTDVLRRYIVARFGAFGIYMGYSPIYEYTERWSDSEVNTIMQDVHDRLPQPRLLTAHDHSASSFTGWMGFSMRQNQSRTVFAGNSRTAGKHGGVVAPFDQKPIIGSEDIWESAASPAGEPRNADEVRRGAWGSLMAGVMPLYSEWYKSSENPGNMPGEAEVIRMFDWWYANTRYRSYEQLNSLVSSGAGQIASGIPGDEYVVYDQDGGSINLDLSGVAGGVQFAVQWFDPTNGTTQAGSSVAGGAVRTLSSPFAADTVAFLSAAASDATPPTVPAAASTSVINENEIDLTWSPSTDPESGVTAYRVYRDGTLVAEPSLPSFADIGLAGGATYAYEISAVNGGGVESAKSPSAAATTPPDVNPPDNPTGVMAASP